MDRRVFLQRERKASLSQRRTYMSVLACIADDKEVQDLLPQVLVCNKRTLSRAGYERVESALRGARSPCLLWRRDTAWVDAFAFVGFLRVLRECLRSLWDEIYIILLLDCSPVHASNRVVTAAAHLGFRVVMIPGSMTGVMQPLDVYSFAHVKKQLRDRFAAQAMMKGEAGVNIEEHCSLVFRVLAEALLCRDWACAFRGCGFGAQQEGLGLRAQQRLNWRGGGPGMVGGDLPSFDDLSHVWIRGRSIPIDALFRLATHAAPDPELGARVSEAFVDPPISSRLRSKRPPRVPAPSIPPSVETSTPISPAASACRMRRHPIGYRLWGVRSPQQRM